MSSDRNIDRHGLHAIEGGDDPSADGRSRLERARDAVEAVFRHAPEPEGPYGHLSPVPSPPAERPGQDISEEEPDQPAIAEATGNVTPITQAPSYRAEGEVDRRYLAIREARLEVEAAVETMPTPDISQLEDLFR